MIKINSIQDRVFQDVKTDVSIRQVTSHPSIHHHPFYYLPAYDDAMRYLFFVSRRTGRPEVWCEVREVNELWQLTDHPDFSEWSVHPSHDGRYVYYVPYGDNPVVVRYDVEKEFTEKGSWSAYAIAQTEGLRTMGFDGAAFDGRYVYFVPFYDGGKDFHGTALRYDTQGDFLAPDSWRAFDAGSTDGLATKGYNGGAFDGRFLYLAPWHDGKEYPPKIEGHGRVLRYDTVGENGSFSLRYADCGHNGGLCAALPGPRFIVNTDHGAVSVAANRILEPGVHHVAGVYDGRRIGLFIDGELANEREASGAIQTNGVPIVVGRIADGTGVFKGKIRHARISDTARSEAWIATEYRNLSAPSAFCRVGNEQERD